MWVRYLILNLDDFDAMKTPDITFNVNLNDIGIKQVRIIESKGTYSIIYDNYILTPYTNDKNAFIYENKIGAYIDKERNLYLGIWKDESN